MNKIMDRFIKFIGSIIDSLLELSDREPSGRTMLVVAILGACLAEYIYYVSSDEGYFLTAIFIVIIGAVLGVIVFSLLKQIPALMAFTIIAGIGMGIFIGLIEFIEFLSRIQLWSK